MNFNQWKNALYSVLKRDWYRVPGDNALIIWFEQGKTPAQVAATLKDRWNNAFVDQ